MNKNAINNNNAKQYTNNYETLKKHIALFESRNPHFNAGVLEILTVFQFGVILQIYDSHTVSY